MKARSGAILRKKRERLGLLPTSELVVRLLERLGWRVSQAHVTTMGFRVTARKLGARLVVHDGYDASRDTHVAEVVDDYSYIYLHVENDGESVRDRILAAIEQADETTMRRAGRARHAKRHRVR